MITPFTLDRFQVEAIDAIDRGESVLVAAPTGSGKTVVAEHAIERARQRGRRTFVAISVEPVDVHTLLKWLPWKPMLPA